MGRRKRERGVEGEKYEGRIDREGWKEEEIDGREGMKSKQKGSQEKEQERDGERNGRKEMNEGKGKEMKERN